MPLGKTEFIDGVFVSYPLEYLPKLFATMGAISRKGFFEKLAELDGAGGEGLSIEQMAEIIRVGILHDKPMISLEDTMKLVSKFNAEYGLEGLENFIIDCFADAKLTDKTEIDKRRSLLKDLKDLEMRKLEYTVHAREEALRETEKKIREKVADMGEPETNPQIQPGNRGRKQKKT